MLELWTALTMLLITFMSAGACYIADKKLRGLIIVGGLSLLLVQSVLVYLPDLKTVVVLAIFWSAQSFNILRAVEKRYQAENTAKRVLNTGINISALCFVCLVLLNTHSVNLNLLSAIFSFSIFLFGLATVYSMNKNLFYFFKEKNITDADLPTVSVLIPARDEDVNLSECINSVLANDYPKLEIIVLDDCSQDKSSEIIKSFAQRGVRFIQGEEPKDNWLAKNQAYEVLAKSASGQWLVFMGVDVSIKRQTIRSLIDGLETKNKKMACVMPLVSTTYLDGLFMPLRIFWELAIPNTIKKFPPSVSTFWAIHKEEFNALGGFGAVYQSVLPERFFAKKLNSKKQYVFTFLDKVSYVETKKNLKDHLDTSRRLLYPQLKKSYSRLFVITLLAILAILQLVYAISGIIGGYYLIMTATLLAYVPLFYGFMLLAKRQGYDNALLRTLLLPYLLIRELVLAYHSAYLYEFSEVIWKGRNVCYPVLKVIPKLPKI